MRNYKHLSLEEREKLYALKKAGLSFRQIAQELNRPHSSLVREFGRNTKYGQEYIPCQAQKLSENRSQSQRGKAPLKEQTILLYVETHLKDPTNGLPNK